MRHVTQFVNSYVAEVHGDVSIFSTVFIGVFNLQDGTLTYVNCGNEPPLVVAHGAVLQALAPTGPVAGIFPDASFTVNEIIFERDQLLLAFTDGVTDAMNEQNVPFGKERLVAIVRAGETAPTALLKAIETRLQSFAGTANQFDDITMIAVNRDS